MSPDSFSDGMFVSNKEWNTAYIHVVYSCLLNNPRHGGGGTLIVFMCYGMNTRKILAAGSGGMG